MSVPTAEVQSLTPGAMVVLYELDATDLGDTIHRFHAGVNGLGTDVVWQGNTYLRMPIQADGFEISSKGVLPRPKIKVAAIDGAMGILVRAYDDLVGAKVTRKRTLAKFLDADNFAPTTATNEPFTPNQLSIGGVPVTAGVTVTGMMRTDWQGAQSLYATARTNLCKQSESMATSPWEIGLNVIGANAALSPRGDMTADSLTKTAEAYRFIYQPISTPTVSGNPYVASVYAKAGTLTKVTLAIADIASVGWDSRVTFDLITKTKALKTSAGYLDSGVEDLGNGWLRVWVAATAATTTGRMMIYPDDYTLAVAGSIYAWGAQFEAGAAPSPYIGPTTSSPVTVTDYAATAAGVVTLGEAESGTYTWSGSGKLNALADPTAAFPDDVFYIERKVYEGPDFLEFELVSALDLEGLLLPRRKFVRNVCTWDDAAICAYSVNGLCPKDRTACEVRWGTGQPLPFGGFLGVSTT